MQFCYRAYIVTVACSIDLYALIRQDEHRGSPEVYA